MPIERLGLAESSVDLIVSNYALHHLRDRDKQVAVNEALRWLRPGGKLVIGDMMFGRGGDARDREIIGSKLALLLRKGPGGWWRIVKNAGRYLIRFQERPVSMSAWAAMFERAGLTDVEALPVVNEAAVVKGTKPVKMQPQAAAVSGLERRLGGRHGGDELGDELGDVDRADSRSEVVARHGLVAGHRLLGAILHERHGVVALGYVDDPGRMLSRQRIERRVDDAQAGGRPTGRPGRRRRRTAA